MITSLIRGFDSLTSGLVLTDGTAEPEVSVYNLYNIERVEVLKGPGAFLYGGNPLSGTVNLMRKKAVFEDVGKLDLSYGSFGHKRTSVDYGVSSEDRGVAFRINGMWRDTDGFRDGRTNESIAFNPTWLFRVNETNTINVDVEYVDLEYIPDSGLPLYNNQLPDVPRERNYQSPSDISDQQVQRYKVEWQAQLNDNITLIDRLYHTELEWLSTGTIFNGVFPSQTSLNDVYRTLIKLDDDQRFTGNQLELKADFSTGAVTHQLLTGLEYVRQKDTFDLDVGYLPNIDLYNPVEYATDTFIPLPGQHQTGETEVDIISPYVIDHMEFGPNCHVFMGARYDAIDFKDKVTGYEGDFDKVSPMFGFLWGATPSQSFYGNFGQAFAAPSTLVLTQDRQPEESQQFEIGWKKNWMSGRLNTTLALFDLERENIAIPDDNGVTKQTGTQDASGLEFELAANLPNRIHAYFSYAYTDAELTEFRESQFFLVDGQPFLQVFDRSGNIPAFVPDHLMNIWVGKDFDSGLGLAAGARYVDDQFIAEDNAYSIDSALTLDAAISFKTARWRASANVKNLTDEEYDTRGFGATSVIPGEGISVVGKFEIHF